LLQIAQSEHTALIFTQRGHVFLQAVLKTIALEQTVQRILGPGHRRIKPGTSRAKAALVMAKQRSDATLRSSILRSTLIVPPLDRSKISGRKRLDLSSTGCRR